MSGGHWSERFRRGPDAGLEAYEDVFVPRVFAPWAERLLDVLDLVPGLAVLDVACGPGTVARLAAARVGPYGAVTGCDLSPGMLALAAAKPPVEGGAAIEYLECPADALAICDDAFDVVTCQQGLQFVTDRSRAMAEMRRVARPGARVGAAVWAPIEESPVFAGLARAVGRVLGPDRADLYRAGPWGLTDRLELQELARNAGFRDVEVRREVMPVVFEGGAEQLVRTLSVTAVASEVADLEEGRTTLLQAAEEELAACTVGGEVRSETAAHILLATA